MEFLKTLKFTHEWWAIVLPCILMVLDIITGYTSAKINKEVSSTKMRKGLGNKLAELVYIVAGVCIAYAFNIKPLEYFISLYIVYMEIVSIIENCKKLGIKPPKEIEEKVEEKTILEE